MTDIAILISDMVRAGVDPDLIGRTAELFAGKRPMTNAERQAKHRASNRIESNESNESNEAVTGVTKEEKEKSLTKKEKEEPQSSQEKTPKGVKKKGSFPRPDDVTEQTWADFLDIRAKKRAPMTETALSGIRLEAESIDWTLEKALRECCSRGWQGFKAAWVPAEEIKTAIAKPIDKSGWEDWHHDAERALSEVAVTQWLVKARRDGPILTFATQPACDWVRQRYAEALGKLGINEFRVGG